MGFFSDVDVNEWSDIQSEEEGIPCEAPLQDDSYIELDDLLMERKIECDGLLENANPQEEKKEIPQEEIIETKPKEKVKTVPDKKSKDISGTIISEDTIVHGGVTAEGFLSVNGTIQGDVSAKCGVNVFRHGIVNGNVNANGRVSIFGNVKGNITGDEIAIEKTTIVGDINSNGLVYIGQDGIVVGNLKATGARIVGAINGNLDVNGHVFLASTAIVQGNIRSKSVEIANGAAINGTCEQCYADVNPAEFFKKINNK